MYQKLYEDIIALNLGKTLTLNDFFHEADRSAEGVYAGFSLGKGDSINENIKFSENYLGTSFVRYEIEISSKPYFNLDDFFKNHDFMSKNYIFLEDIFKKTLNPQGNRILNEIKYEDDKEGGYVTRNFSSGMQCTDNICVFTDGAEAYFLHMQFRIDNVDKSEIFGAINKSRAITHQYVNKSLQE
jgi:hypothetical protein